MDLLTFIDNAPVPSIPPQYRPLVEPAKKIGTRLGDAIADGWDRLIDRLFCPHED